MVDSGHQNKETSFIKMFYFLFFLNKSFPKWMRYKTPEMLYDFFM